MNKSAYTIMSILAIIAIIGSPVTAFAQYDIPDELGFLNPITAGATKVVTTTADSGILIIGALIILGIGFLVGKAIEKATKEIIKKIYKIGQEHKETKGILGSESDSITDPKNLIPITLKWFAYIIFIIASVNALGFEDLSNALSNLWLWIPNILASVVVLILGTILVRFIDKWILERKFFGTDETSGQTVKTVIKVVIYSVVVSIAVTQLGVGEDVIPILVEAFAWGIAGAFALAFGLGLWKIIPEWISGKDNERLGLKTGNRIEIPVEDGQGQTIKGEIVEVGMTKVKINLGDNKYQLINHSLLDDIVLTIEETKKNE
jgi:hypothetical protein